MFAEAVDVGCLRILDEQTMRWAFRKAVAQEMATSGRSCFGHGAAAKLCVFLPAQYDVVINSFVNQTPSPPDVEPWDFENLLNPVVLIPEHYVSAIATMEDDRLLAVAKKMCALPELSFYKIEPTDMGERLGWYRDFAAQSLKAKKPMLLLLTT